MKVGLVDVMDKRRTSNGPNVAIAALAGYLAANGHEVGVLDLFHSRRGERRRFLESAWGLVGVSASSFDFSVGLRIATEIKRRTGAPIVFGGPHASVARGDVLAEPAVDYAIYGEGEIPLLALAGALEGGGPPAAGRLGAIKGLVFRDGRRVVVNEPQPRIADLDALPPPAYHLLPMDRYSEHHLSTSRGCPFACGFCASGAILGKKWIARSPEKIVEEMEGLVRDFGKKTFVIVDDTFNLDIERVKRFCRLLLERRLRISWLLMAGIRADRTEPEMLRLMKASGCLDFGIGVESSDPTVLRNVGKGETVEDISRGIRLIKEAGFRLHGSFMIGNPGDTLETVRRSIEFAKAQALDGIFVYHALPFPSTRLWEFVGGQGRFLRTDYINFDKTVREPVFETPEFPRADRVEAYRLALEAFPGADPVGPEGPPLARYARALYRELRDHGVRSAARRAGSFLARRAKGKAAPALNTRAPPG